MKDSIRTAIVGIGNCASSLVQLVAAAQEVTPEGISHERIGGYSVADIKWAGAFDVDDRKVGCDLSEAIRTEPNCTTSYMTVPGTGIQVTAGPVLDGVSGRLSDVIEVTQASRSAGVADVSEQLRQQEVDVVVLFLPVGSNRAAKAYAKATLNAGAALVNCTPAQIATSDFWADAFSKECLPLLGDDVKSQIGSTVLHRAVLDILKRRGVSVRQTYQLNIGGNTDFLNMRDPQRGDAKKATKSESLRTLVEDGVKLSVGPSDYVPFLDDRKVGYIHIDGTGPLGMSFSVEMRLDVEDSPNSAGIVINALRCAKTALDRGRSGVISEVCSYLFKNPMHAMSEEECFSNFDQFIASQ